MKRILLISDTHGELERTQALQKRYPDLDYYIHLGDVGFDAAYLPHFHIVCGNHDAPDAYLQQEILQIEGFSILLIHGFQKEMELYENIRRFDGDNPFHYFIHCLEDSLASYAATLGCNAVFHGHTHVRCDRLAEGVRIVNPGSLFMNREELDRSYALVQIDQKQIEVEFFCEPLSL